MVGATRIVLTVLVLSYAAKRSAAVKNVLFLAAADLRPELNWSVRSRFREIPKYR